MDDLIGVQSLLVRQRRVGDAQDEEGTRACWAKDATLTVIRDGEEVASRNGRDEVVAFAADVWKTGRHSNEGHVYLHFDGPAEIEATGEGRALARSRVLMVTSQPGEHQILHFGNYTDEVIVEDGAWRLLNRTVRLSS
jgi:hypothetical protein